MNNATLKIEISEDGKAEIKKLCFKILETIDNILKYVPKKDLIGISHIFITSLPGNKRKDDRGIMASYFKKQGKSNAYIEIYLGNLFGHINSSDSFKMMLPIQEYGLARIIYHEIGHHVRHIRSHGIKSKNSEKFANAYTNILLSKYLIEQAPLVNKCFVLLETVGVNKGMSKNVIQNMKRGWEAICKQIGKSEGHS